jgi:ABC-2 type transport system permease protein
VGELANGLEMMSTLFPVISISGMILLPLILAIAWRRRYMVPWWLFCTGMLTFVMSQLYHFPLNDWLTELGLIGQVAPGAPALLRTAAVLGLSAGFSESVARAIAYWVLFRRNGRSHSDRISGQSWTDGVMLGLGHGGIEAMGLIAVVTAASISSLRALRGVDLATLDLSPAQLSALNMQLELLHSSPWLLFVPLVERAIAILLHVILSLLVWSAFRRRNPSYLLLAILYHALVDGTLIYVGQYVRNSWLLEGILATMLLPGLLWIWRWVPRVGASTPRHVRTNIAQLRLFVAALRKELQQQWHTKRMLVVLSVFMLFGLGSPLIAKFTPELLRTIEGAEQFADLIPTPSAEDAMDQYVKNITQFGFIIALLLGMGAVAGEKERGMTAMILSKPMPRWSFVVSKFVAQALVYALGFLLAALGAHYYTLILFDGFNLSLFLVSNALLWVWLLVFAAITLLGSTIGQTTAAASGMALLGSVLLLLAGSLPKIGAFAPSGLVAWASQLGLGGNVTANSGALVANIVIIVVSLITAVAVFETQEL